MDWRDRFRAPVVSHAAVAADNPDRGVVLSDLGGKFQAYAWDRSGDDLSQVTDSETAVLSAAISPDGSRIYAPVESEPGTEIGHIHSFPFDGGEPEDLTPELEPYTIFHLQATRRGVIGVGAAGGAPGLVVVDDRGVRVLRTESLIIGLALSGDETIAGVTSTTPGRGLTPVTRLIDLITEEVVGEYPETRVGAIRGGEAAVAVLRGDWMRPGILRGGEIHELEVDVPGDVIPVDWCADGSKILMLRTHRSQSAVHLYDVASGTESEMPIPGGAIHPPEPSLIDSSTAIAIWSDAKHPRRAIELTMEGWRVAVEVDEGDPFPGPRWEEFTCESTEQAEIQGWLLRPDGDGPWPTVLYTHGGPTSVALPSFNAICSAWFDAGFAVASINYRGSTTFGQSFREALTGRIGGPDIDDVVAARRWLVDQGIADSDRIVKNGYSYGGYLTLQALGTHPDLWAAGVAGAPIADWTVGYDDMNDALKAYDMSIWGCRPDERPEASARASPRTYAADFQAPILITQPEADTRTPLKPVQVFVEDLKAEGKEVELRLLKGGHAGSGKEQTIEMVELWLEFAVTVLDGV